MTRKFALTLLALAALGACATYNAASDTREWIFNTDSGEPRLAYGTPQSDDAPILMNCRPGSNRVTISQNALRAGDGITMVSGEARTTFHGQAEADQLNGGTIVTVEAPLSSPVVAQFARTGRLSIEQGGRRVALPSTPDERQLIQRFFTSCAA